MSGRDGKSSRARLRPRARAIEPTATERKALVTEVRGRNSGRKLLTDLLGDPNPIRAISAEELSVDVLLPHTTSDDEAARLLKVFALHALETGDPGASLQLLEASFARARDLETIKNMTVVARQTKNGPRILTFATDEIANDPPSTELAAVYDTLCHLAGHLKDLPRAIALGRKSLEMKDEIATEADAATAPKPTFNWGKLKRNVVAFSLYGTNRRYTLFAVENVRAMQHVLPGWTARFYVDDTVPAETLKVLRALGAEIVERPRHDPARNSGLFWRFDVATDPDIDFFMCRDADSVITVREKVAIDAFLASDALFHVMRDYYTHSELILAGMWGGVAGALPPMADLIAKYDAEMRGIVTVNARNQDQMFLRRHVWPRIRHSVMTHDSVFGFGPTEGASSVQDFPQVGMIHPVRHVGQNMAVFLKPQAKS